MKASQNFPLFEVSIKIPVVFPGEVFFVALSFLEKISNFENKNETLFTAFRQRRKRLRKKGERTGIRTSRKK